MILGPKKSLTEIEEKYNFDNDFSLAKVVINQGGKLKPLIIPSALTQGTGLMNPSILNDNGKIIVNIRHVNYTFYHSEKKTFQHPWGPLTYLHPENDMHLRTTNWYCELDDDLSITKFSKIDTTKFDTYEPRWDFVGLEDARLVRWEGKLYITGVRRDTTPNGQGRMELSEIEVSENGIVSEVNRYRIQPPKDPLSYCEKNWMPVIDQPFTFIKWSNPTEVVRANILDCSSTTTHMSSYVNIGNDLRGGTQVLQMGEFFVALVHEVDLFTSEAGRKDAVYRHRFVIWDKDWNIRHFTKDFSIMNGHVEFAVGMCLRGDDVLITFGFQDNAAYVLSVPTSVLENFINDN
jgi:hypothetical protein